MKLQLILQNRLDNNVSEYGQLNVNPELNYALFKRFKVIGGYVIGKVRRLDASYYTRHQAYAGFSYKLKFGRMALTYRNLLQAQARSVLSSDKGELWSWFERNKFTLSYQINKRVECYLAQEFNTPFSRFSEMPVNRYRSFIGSQLNLSKKTYVEAYFLLQTKFTFKSQPSRDFVYGLTLSHSF